MDEVEDEPLFADRVAGLDIGKAGVEVTVRVPGDTAGGRRRQETRTFGTTRRELLDLAAWLARWEVVKAGMEATGDYWKPVFFLLESRGLECELYNAGQVKALPGRPKTDRADSIWLAKITERGMISSSFVPPEPIRRLRTHTRYRRHLTQARTAEKQRVEKLLEDGHLKLSSVISDIHGVSGRDMLDALATGQRDPKALAQLARGSMRGKMGRLEEALDCSFFTDQHAAVLAMMLAAIDCHSTQIAALTATIETLIAPYLHQVEQIDAVHGIGRISAQDIIAEIGTDMTVFPTAAHLVSWARWSPQVKQSAGKRKGSNSTGRGNPYLGAALGEAAMGAARTPSFPGARYRRLTRRMPKKKALVATGNSMLTIVHALLANPDASYHDLGPSYYEQRMHTRRQARNHIRNLERLGYQVTIQAIHPDTGELLPTTG
jgi:transposase